MSKKNAPPEKGSVIKWTSVYSKGYRYQLDQLALPLRSYAIIFINMGGRDENSENEITQRFFYFYIQNLKDKGATCIKKYFEMQYFYVLQIYLFVYFF